MVANVKTVSFTDEQAKVWRASLKEKLSDAEFASLVGFARARGLNPLAGHFIVQRRGGRVTAVTTINALREIADSTGERDGEDPAEWMDRDGNWHQAWPRKEAPLAARITVYRKGHTRGYPSIVNHADYAANGSWWNKSGGAHMLAKCAEALALRKAFPGRLGHLYLAEEMEQAASNGEKPTVVAEAVPQPKPDIEPHLIVRLAQAEIHEDFERLLPELKSLEGKEHDWAIDVYKAHKPHIGTDEKCLCEDLARSLLKGAAGA